MAVKKEKTELKFTKENIMNSKKFSNRKSLLEALLDNKKRYSLSEVESILKTYLKRGVK